jgi:hypothetical protein
VIEDGVSVSTELDDAMIVPGAERPDGALWNDH